MVNYTKQVKNKPLVDASEYNWLHENGQGVSGDLSASGAGKVLTFLIKPYGLAVGAYVRITAGVGTAETALITATTGDGGGAGTVTVTTANTHTGAWRVGSATAGLQEAQWVLASTGGTVSVPAGSYTLYAPFVKRPIPVFIRGAGEDVTNFTVDTSFGLSHAGVFTTPDDLAVYNTAYLTSGGFSDFTVSFTQPDSDDYADYTAWPPAIYAQKQSRLLIEQVKIMRAYDAITIDGYNGPTIRDVKASFVRRGISLSSIVDSTRVEGFHAWPFGMTANQNMVMIYGSNTQAFWVGKADDLKIIGAAVAANFGTFYSQGSGLLTGDPWAEIIGSDLDSGGLTVQSGRVRVLGGIIGATQDATYRPAQKSIIHTGGELEVSHTWLGSEPANATTALVDLDFSTTATPSDQGTAYAIFSKCRFSWNKDANFVHAHTTGANHGTVIIEGCRWNNPASVAAALSNPLVLAEGRVKVLLTDNSVNDKASLLGYFFSSDSDMGHIVHGNTAPHWSIEYPTLNATMEVSGNTGLVNPVPMGSAVASAGSPAGVITPTGRTFHVTGTDAVATIATSVVMGGVTVPIHEITIIPDDIFTWNSSDNIAVAGTAVVARPIHFVYDTATSKWYPSYV